MTPRAEKIGPFGRKRRKTLVEVIVKGEEAYGGLPEEKNRPGTVKGQLRHGKTHLCEARTAPPPSCKTGKSRTIPPGPGPGPGTTGKRDQ